MEGCALGSVASQAPSGILEAPDLSYSFLSPAWGPTLGAPGTRHSLFWECRALPSPPEDPAQRSLWEAFPQWFRPTPCPLYLLPLNYSAYHVVLLVPAYTSASHH